MTATTLELQDIELVAGQSVIVSRRMDSRARTERIPQLDGLRGVAILLVVMCHYIGNADHARLGYWPHHFLSGLTVGWSGVDLFFVLSGFLIGGILLDNRDSPRYFRTFYARRVFRILPVYYLWILLYVVFVAIGAYKLVDPLPQQPRYLAIVPIYVLFLQNMIYALSPFQWKWFAVTWSLAVEEQFYLLAPIAVRFISIRRLVWLLAALVCAAPLLRLAAFTYLPKFSYLAGFAMPCRADALALGILVAIGWRREAFRRILEGRPAILWGSSLALFVAVAGLAPTLVRPVGVATYTVGYSVLALFYTCALLLALSQTNSLLVRLLRLRWLGYVGGISYCVYIIHLTINQWAHILLLHSEPEIYDLRGVGVTLLSLFVTWAVAATSWRYMEGPAIRRGHQYAY
jgi:peptidoglycan/LPS O-acetylase OafA/YrhL